MDLMSKIIKVIFSILGDMIMCVGVAIWMVIYAICLPFMYIFSADYREMRNNSLF